MEHLENKFPLATQLIRELCQTDLPKEVDFLAISRFIFDELKTKVSFVYKTIEREGKIIYEK
jgi:hypothetical protein